MPGPFYNAIKGTTAGTPGTGAFTPNAASSGFRAWSTVPTGWVGLVRFEDGSDWELQYCYWNGTTLSRSATAQFVASSTGSGLTLTSAATAAMVNDANEVGPDFTAFPSRGFIAVPGIAAPTSVGGGTLTSVGTAQAGSVATTNFLTQQMRTESLSATTANAQAGWGYPNQMMVASSTAGNGGWLFHTRFGATGLPTGPRLFIGPTGSTFVANTGEPSAFVNNYAVLGKDSTDTNMQFLTNSNAGAGTKIDTGIALVANGWYDLTIWSEPGSLTVYMLLVRLDTGAIYYGSTATDVPVTGTTMRPQLIGGLNGTNTGTAITLAMSHLLVRAVS